MDLVIPGLHASDPAPLGFAPGVHMRAFLIEPARTLVYSAPTVDADAVAPHGGVAHVVLNHWHEAEFGGGAEVSAALGVPLAGERFAPLPALAPDVEAIPIPGHTPEATAFLWQGVLFTGDSVYVDDAGEWAGAVLDSSDRAAYVESLERLRELEFELLVPWIASAGAPAAVRTDRDDARRRLGALIERLRGGADR
jgi:glyoxylase-like metal-dependent hydrolase (beta-lactamase superfamily II)